VWSSTAILAATACLLVTRPTTPALADAIRTREFARTVETPLVGVVVNRASAAIDTDPIASTLGAPVTTIPDSDRLASAQEAGRPVSELAPESDPARAFEQLAGRIQSALNAS
jgi:septum site-determining protein MinD